MFQREQLNCGVVRRRDGSEDIVVFGGMTGSGISSDVQFFHTDTKTWSSGKKLI